MPTLVLALVMLNCRNRKLKFVVYPVTSNSEWPLLSVPTVSKLVETNVCTRYRESLYSRRFCFNGKSTPNTFISVGREVLILSE